jgi:predicted RNase H-like HicB family nuclease
MSGRSSAQSKTSKKTAKASRGKQALDRPFDAAILRKAGEIAGQYRLVLEQDDDGGYIGSTVEMPLAMGDGKTVDACVKSTLDGTIAAVATLLEAGEAPPSPSREGKREHQVNIRLSADEKFRLEHAAQAQGYRSLSDYMRAAALGRAS